MNFHSEQLGAQHIFKLSRFGSATKEDIQDLHDQKDSLNTKKSVNHSVKYCREKGSNVEFEKLDPKELDEYWSYSMLISGRKIANSTSLVHLAFILK